MLPSYPVYCSIKNLEFRVIFIFFNFFPVTELFEKKFACQISLGLQILKDDRIDGIILDIRLDGCEKIHSGELDMLHLLALQYL